MNGLDLYTIFRNSDIDIYNQKYSNDYHIKEEWSNFKDSDRNRINIFAYNVYNWMSNNNYMINGFELYRILREMDKFFSDDWIDLSTYETNAICNFTDNIVLFVRNHTSSIIKPVDFNYIMQMTPSIKLETIEISFDIETNTHTFETIIKYKNQIIRTTGTSKKISRRSAETLFKEKYEHMFKS